jgi:hypothetical protein
VPLLDAVFELSEAQFAMIGLFFVLVEFEIIAAVLLGPLDPLAADDLQMDLLVGPVLVTENVDFPLDFVSGVVLPFPQRKVDLQILVSVVDCSHTQTNYLLIHKVAISSIFSIPLCSQSSNEPTSKRR